MNFHEPPKRKRIIVDAEYDGSRIIIVGDGRSFPQEFGKISDAEILTGFFARRSLQGWV